MTLDVGTRLGRSEIRSQLGAGGMGEVYLAQDSQLDRTMALKILPADVASQAFLKLWGAPPGGSPGSEESWPGI